MLFSVTQGYPCSWNRCHYSDICQATAFELFATHLRAQYSTDIQCSFSTMLYEKMVFIDVHRYLNKTKHRTICNTIYVFCPPGSWPLLEAELDETDATNATFSVQQTTPGMSDMTSYVLSLEGTPTPPLSATAAAADVSIGHTTKSNTDTTTTDTTITDPTIPTNTTQPPHMSSTIWI